jgi:hypothetical protein
MICNNHVVTGITQAYRKALMADPTYKTASENLAIVLTDSRYAVSRSCFIPYGEVC